MSARSNLRILRGRLVVERHDQPTGHGHSVRCSRPYVRAHRRLHVDTPIRVHVEHGDCVPEPGQIRRQVRAPHPPRHRRPRARARSGACSTASTGRSGPSRPSSASTMRRSAPRWSARRQASAPACVGPASSTRICRSSVTPWRSIRVCAPSRAAPAARDQPRRLPGCLREGAKSYAKDL